MCWQEADDRPTAEDILAFLQQIEEEMTSQSHDTLQTGSLVPAVEMQPVQTGIQSPSFESKFVMSKSVNQSNKHVAEVLVHRVDNVVEQGFEDDFNRDIVIRKNTASGFEDDFVSGSNLNETNLSQDDSILAGGGADESANNKDVFASDHNLNFLQPPVPVGMSTPSKPVTSVANGHSNAFNTATSNQNLQISNSNYVTANDGATSNYSTSNNIQTTNEDNFQSLKSVGNSANRGSKSSRNLFGEKSDSNHSDDGYRTEVNSAGPDIILSPTQQGTVQKYSEDSGTESLPQNSDLSPKITDLETEKAKELYLNKGLGLPTSVMHKSRSLGTIPEDGIPSDNTSQNGAVFDEENEDNEGTEDVGMNFEWDDYEGEQLVGRVRFMSEESAGSAKSPRHVEVEEWPFDQDSGSENRSKPGSIASDSDAEVTKLSIGSNTSIDTRARIASILTNRLNSLIVQQSNPTPVTKTSKKSSLYLFADDEYDLDSPENAFSDTDHPLSNASNDYDYGSSSSSFSHDHLSYMNEHRELETVREVEMEEYESELPVESSYQGQVIIH